MNKVLLVDNSSVIVNVLKDFFAKKNNFEIYAAKSLDEVQSLLSKHKFYASISKVVLPDSLNGEHIKLLDSQSIPTVVLTSKMDEDIDSFISFPNVIDYVYKDSIYGLESVYSLIELLSFIEKMEVLIVDDSPVITAKIKDVLNTLLLDVHVAKNGKEALDKLKENPKISLVITDCHMDEINGLELIGILKKEEKYSSLPIMVMTTDDSRDLKAKLYKKGANDLLLKPILEEEFKSKIISIFSNMKQVTELKSFDKVFDENVISSSTDTRGNIIKVSQAFCDIAGYSKEELIGNPQNIVRHPDMPSSIFKELWETIKSGKKWRGEVKNLRKDGSFYWVKVVIEPNFDRTGNIKGFTSVRQDITDKKRIYNLSITDGLTSLYNRRYFNEVANEILAVGNRNDQVVAFMLLDIDNFKKYNDTYGHQDGDNVLIEVSNSLKNTFKREEDKVFRLGGEEFGVLIHAKNKDDVRLLSDEARQNIQDLKIEHKKNEAGVVTASFGVSILDLDNKDTKLDEIYKKTDDSLYVAKENGRNTIEVVEL